MTKKTVSLLTVLTTLNIMMLPAFANPMGDAIVAGFQANTEKKIEKANNAKDYSGELTFMNNHLKLDKAFTKRYNELQPNEVGSCNVGTLSDDCPDGYKLTAETTKKSNRENIEYWENQMMRANTLSALGTIYACATTAYEECHYIGGAGGIAKTVNGGAKFIRKVAEFFGKDAIVEKDFDIREDIVETNVSGDDACRAAMESSSATATEYLAKLRNCEHIDQVTLSGYTEEDIQQLADEYESAKETEQSKANRLLTSASMAATGIGGMELAQGLAEQKADKAADADMSAYISTMRCSYGNGKSVKAGMDEIELPGGNDANLMKYRSEYTALANDLKERKTALNMMPGIESEEILDKSQMGLYDDENVGITAGNYASRYRAQMLGSESDQTQLDEAAKTSKTRVIGGAVAAGVGVVGGIVGDELINQSLSSSTKTAQTCTESGGTWQGGRCHCPDGYIQHTKTGPCFEEQPTEVQTTTPPQRNNQVLSSNGSGNNGSDGNGQSASTSDGDDGAGDSDEKGDSSIVDITDTSFEEDEFESAEFDETTDAAVIEYEKSEMCRKFNGNWQNGKCLCTNNFTSNQYIECVQDTNAPTFTTNAAKVAAAGTVNGGIAAPQSNNSTKTPSATETNKSDSPDTNISSATKSKNTKADEAQSDTTDTKETEQKKVKERPSQNSPKSTPPRANTTEATKTNTEQKKTLVELIGKNNLNADPTNWRAKMNNGTTVFCEVKGDFMTAKMERCSGLGEWWWDAKFSYGTIQGKSKCTKNSNTGSQTCYCYVSRYTNNNGKTYVFTQSQQERVNSYTGAGSARYECAASCPKYCAQTAMSDYSKRQNIFNKSGVHQ